MTAQFQLNKYKSGDENEPCDILPPKELKKGQRATVLVLEPSREIKDVQRWVFDVVKGLQLSD